MTRAAAQKPSSLLWTAGGAASPSPPRGWDSSLQHLAVGSRDHWCLPCWPRARDSPRGTPGPGPTEERKVEHISQKTLSCDWQTWAYWTHHSFLNDEARTILQLLLLSITLPNCSPISSKVVYTDLHILCFETARCIKGASDLNT